MLYVNNLSFDDNDTILAILCGIIWPMYLAL